MDRGTCPRTARSSPADPTADGAGALLIFKAADETALNELLKQDPFAAAGAISGTRTSVWAPLTGLLAEHAA